MNTKLLAMIVLMPIALSACGAKDEADAGASSRATQPESEGAEEHGQDKSAGEEGGGRIELTNEQIQAAGIAVVEATPARIRETLPLYGVIVPNAERVREVVARFPGAIRTVNKKVGDSVRQGETLATIESDESLQTYALVTPLAGVVTARNANQGEHTGDKPLFTVADLSTVWMELSLFPRDVGKARVGQMVRVKNADTNRIAEGKLIYVAPFGSSNQTMTARVPLDNSDGHWPPGLYVTAQVILGGANAPVAVASEALQTVEGHPVVFVRAENGFDVRQVQLGRSDGEFTEVLAGVEAGESYATKNSFILKAELGKGEAEHED